MRTTIELDDNLRGQLLELAAQRGLKGFSSLIQEAVEAWLQNQAGQQAARLRAVALMGTLSSDDATALQCGAADARAAIASRGWE